MNEQNTKAALDDPVLRALGWDVGNLEEVLQNTSGSRTIKPIDIRDDAPENAEIISGGEGPWAKFGHPKLGHQIMGYAAVAVLMGGF